MVASKNLGVILTGVVATMLTMAYASVPLYRLFCQKTGYGGTTQVAKTQSTKVVDREITVRFNADTHRDLPWHFRPLQTQIKVKIGENALAFYESQNWSDKPVCGMATYNVTPDKAGIYFNKVSCFCFEEQVLSPQQRVEMPVQFFIDPDFANDPDLKDVKAITLSYTFFRFNK
ncbi:MAG: cytochrome oxidase assembly protein [Alphaproteobacteria bacterium]|jgi:cytochrome c oxidase assembly protein subunit 11|nr:cytochrome oxidase assembly protein [Alphaproteobacteria bacterium]